MKKISIIFWEDYLTIAPTIISLCNSFSQKGYKVDVYTTKLNPRYPEINFNNDNIVIFQLLKKNKNPESGLIFRSLISLFTKINIPNFIFYTFKKIYKSIQEYKSLAVRKKFKNFIIPKISEKEYEMCIVTDASGFSTININNYPKDFFIFLSLEIEYIKNINLLLSPFKYFSTKNLNKNLFKISNIIIQDEPRLKELINEAHLNIEKLKAYYIPNTFPPAISLTKTSYLQNKFNIKNDIILHIGQISDVSMSLEIAKSLNNQNDFSLVFHDKKFTNINDPYLVKIKNSTNSKIFFSLEPVEISELDKIILSSKIGILAYSLDYGMNFELIANASGKLVMFLRLGIPIVVMEFHGIREIVEKYNCGIVVNDWNQVVPSCHEILSNYDYYHINSLRCFHECFNFNTYFESFYNQLNFKK